MLPMLDCVLIDRGGGSRRRACRGGACGGGSAGRRSAGRGRGLRPGTLLGTCGCTICRAAAALLLLRVVCCAITSFGAKSVHGIPNCRICLRFPPICERICVRATSGMESHNVPVNLLRLANLVQVFP